MLIGHKCTIIFFSILYYIKYIQTSSTSRACTNILNEKVYVHMECTNKTKIGGNIYTRNSHKQHLKPDS